MSIRRKSCFALLTLLSFLVGCAEGNGDHGAKKAKPVVLGFSAVVSWGDWNGPNVKSIRDAARDAGIELRHEDARHSQEKQVSILRAFVSQRVDVIAFSPVVETGWDMVL